MVQEIFKIYLFSKSDWFKKNGLTFLGLDQLDTKTSVHRVCIKGFFESGFLIIAINILPVLKRSCPVGCWECAYAGKHHVLWEFWYIIKIADLCGQGLPALCACASPGETISLAMMNPETTRKGSFKFLAKFSWQTRENGRKVNYA